MAKRDIQSLAKEHAATALAVLVQIAKDGESEAARVSAANAIRIAGAGSPRSRFSTPAALK